MFSHTKAVGLSIPRAAWGMNFKKEERPRTSTSVVLTSWANRTSVEGTDRLVTVLRLGQRKRRSVAIVAASCRSLSETRS